MKLVNYVKFYAWHSSGNPNYLYTFKVEHRVRAQKVLKKFKKVKAAWYVEKLGTSTLKSIRIL